MIIRRIGVWSAARLLGVLYGAIGLILGGVISLVSLAGAAMGQALGGEGGAAGAIAGMVMGVGAVIIFPLIYGVMGLLGGALSAFIYNLAAKAMGGIEMDIDYTQRPNHGVPRPMAATA